MSEVSPARAAESRRGRSILSALLAVAIGIALVVAGPVPRAAAADFGSTPITSASLTPTTLGHSATGRVDFTWVAPVGAAPGDTFSVTLPDQLEPVSTRDIELVDVQTGEVAVRGVWTGKTAVFTFQTYIAANTGVRGTGFFYVRWDHDVTGDPAATYNDLELAGHPLPPITKGAAGPPVQTRDASKGGGWASAEQLQFTWALSLPGTTVSTLAGPITVIDEAPAGAGFAFDCGAARMRVDLGGYPSTSPSYVVPSTIADSAFSCSGTALTLTLASIPAGTFYTLLLPVTITDQTRTTFENAATFEWPALNGTPQIEPAELRRDDAGGTVEADAPAPPPPAGTVCVGNLVWEDVDKDGVQDAGEPGIPGVAVQLSKVGADGSVAPVSSGGAPMSVMTDDSGLYTFCALPVLVPGERYRTGIALDQPALRVFAVTLSGRGGAAADSSAAEGRVDSVLDLTVAGASDLTLDYGFVRTGVGALADSGPDDSAGTLALFGIFLLLAGVRLTQRSRRTV